MKTKSSMFFFFISFLLNAREGVQDALILNLKDSSTFEHKVAFAFEEESSGIVVQIIYLTDGIKDVAYQIEVPNYVSLEFLDDINIVFFSHYLYAKEYLVTNRLTNISKKLVIPIFIEEDSNAQFAVAVSNPSFFDIKDDPLAKGIFGGDRYLNVKDILSLETKTSNLPPVAHYISYKKLKPEYSYSVFLENELNENIEKYTRFIQTCYYPTDQENLAIKLYSIINDLSIYDGNEYIFIDKVFSKLKGESIETRSPFFTLNDLDKKAASLYVYLSLQEIIDQPNDRLKEFQMAKQLIKLKQIQYDLPENILNQLFLIADSMSKNDKENLMKNMRQLLQIKEINQGFLGLNVDYISKEYKLGSTIRKISNQTVESVNSNYWASIL